MKKVEEKEGRQTGREREKDVVAIAKKKNYFLCSCQVACECWIEKRKKKRRIL